MGKENLSTFPEAIKEGFAEKMSFIWPSNTECLITSPGGMHETSAQAWCIGKTHRNRVERWDRDGEYM